MQNFPALREPGDTEGDRRERLQPQARTIPARIVAQERQLEGGDEHHTSHHRPAAHAIKPIAMRHAAWRAVRDWEKRNGEIGKRQVEHAGKGDVKIGDDGHGAVRRFDGKQAGPNGADAGDDTRQGVFPALASVRQQKRSDCAQSPDEDVAHIRVVIAAHGVLQIPAAPCRRTEHSRAQKGVSEDKHKWKKRPDGAEPLAQFEVGDGAPRSGGESLVAVVRASYLFLV